jgi:hypothetical protein
MPTYYVILSGHGIKVPSVPLPIIGFFAGRRVRASNKAAAAEIAKDMIAREWRAGEYAASNIGREPELEVDEIQEMSLLSRLFSRASFKGYTFYCED